MPKRAWSEVDALKGVRTETELQSPRVLIADDDDDLRELLVDALRGDGYQVIAAEDGRRLLNVVSSRIALCRERTEDALDLIVCDVFMSGPDGLWALATLQLMDSDTPFLVMTASQDPEVLDKAARLGAVDVLQKPIDLGNFRAAVQKLAGSP